MPKATKKVVELKAALKTVEKIRFKFEQYFCEAEIYHEMFDALAAALKRRATARKGE